MLFGDGVGFSGLFATHPPLLKRIQALEPQFRADQLDDAGAALDRAAAERAGGGHAPGPGRRQRRAPAGGGDASSTSPRRWWSRRSRNRPPTTTAAPMRSCAAIPDSLRALAARRDAVMPLLLGLLLAERARRWPASSAPRSPRAWARRWPTTPRACSEQLLDELHPMLRLPLAALAFPVLRLRPRPELDTFLDTVHAVVNADGEVSLFEYCLGRLLQVQVRESLDPATHAQFGRRKLDGRAQRGGDAAVRGRAGRQRRSRRRAARLPRRHPARAAARPPAVPAARQRRAGAGRGRGRRWTRSIRWPGRRWSKAITAAISHDGRITVAESELLRTICGVLHCPLPPMLERA